MFKKFKRLDLGIDRYTRDRLKEELEKSLNKETEICSIQYNKKLNKFEVFYYE